jgi:hypothetical protein
MAYTRKSYVGGAVAASISAALNAGATTVTITGTDTSWNGLGGASPNNTAFYLSIGYGTSTEEKVLVGPADYNWASGSVTVSVTRGQDGTSDQYHASGTTVVPVMTATDLNEANYAVSETVGNISAIGDLLYGDAVNSLARLSIGANNSVLTSNGSGVAPSWKTIASLLPAIADLFIATSTTANTSATVSVSGFTKYVVVGVRYIQGGAGTYNANIDFGASTTLNVVGSTLTATGQYTTIVTFYAVEGVPTTATTVNLNCTGTTPTAAQNRLFVIGLSA